MKGQHQSRTFRAGDVLGWSHKGDTMARENVTLLSRDGARLLSGLYYLEMEAKNHASNLQHAVAKGSATSTQNDVDHWMEEAKQIRALIEKMKDVYRMQIEYF